MPSRISIVIVVVALATLALAGPALALQRPPLWQQEWQPKGITFVQQVRLAAGPKGDLWVAGTGMTGRSDSDVFVARCRADGTRRWGRTLDFPVHGNQWMTEFAVDARGEIVLAGHVYTAAGRMRSFVVKLGTKGQSLWSRLSPKSPGVDRNVMDVVTDASRNIYVAGMGGATASAEDWALTKYSPSGKKLWARYRDGAHSMDSASAVAIDAKGRVYATGYLYTPTAASEMYTARYTSSGRRVWGRVWDAGVAPAGHDRAMSIAVTSAGCVVGGYSTPASTLEQGRILRYSAAGEKTLDWEAGIFGVARLQLTKVAVAGDQIAAAGTGGALTGSDQYFCAVSIGGDAGAGRAHLANSRAPGDGCKALAMGSSGRVYLTGIAGDVPPGRTARTLEWQPADLSVPWYSDLADPPGGMTGEDLSLRADSLYVVGTSAGACMLAKYAR